MFKLGIYDEAVKRALVEARDRQLAQRLWQRDHTLWKPDPTEIANRLGWLDCPSEMAERVEEIAGFVAEVRGAGYTHVVLLGMGGSSLAPEVFRSACGVTAGNLDLTVLDSTDPRAVHERLSVADPATTLYLVSTKSGGTVETLSLFLHCYRRAATALGSDRAGAHFAAITDPGSRLEQMAGELGFRRTFCNDPNIGGRYSALSYFGLVPAALVGVDLERLLGRARDAAGHCRQSRDNPGVELGTALGVLAQAGRDKLTLVLPPQIAGLGDWVEQLVAESLGKEGKGILPVVGEPLGAPDTYGADRVFAAIGEDADTAGLALAGHPVLSLPLEDAYDLGYQFFLWEVATAVAGAWLGVNPFDQPNVETAKIRAQEMVAAYRETGTLPAPAPTLEVGGVGIWAEFPVGSTTDALARFLGQARPGDYLAVHAYLPPGAQMDAALRELRLAARDRGHLAVTVGYGPRFLHSTGQLHKGDRGNGLFLQLTCDPQAEVRIPDGPDTNSSSLGFGTLIAAQALGDRQALLDADRRVLRLHLGNAPLERISELATALRA